MIRFPGFGQRNNDGPPDLDEVFRDLNRKIKGVFGGKGQVRNGGEPSADLPVLPILGLIVVIWLATGFYIVDQGSRGVVLRFGKHIETTREGPHWHIPYPVESVEVVNMEQVRTVEVGYRSDEGGSYRKNETKESLMLTDDENIIDLQFAVQYNLKSVEEFLFKNRFSGNSANAEDTVRGIAETAIREIVGKSKMDFALYEGREELASNTKTLMQQILDRYQTGVNVVNVTMQNAQPPEQVQAAFDDAVKAKQDLERQKNEGQAYANDVIPKARGTASRLAEEAAGYKLRVENEAKGEANRFEQVLSQYNKAPDVTRERMYIDAQEQVLKNTSKVMVDQKGGNSLLYLPLDKILGSTSSGTVAAPPIQSSAPSVQLEVDERSRASLNSRERTSR